MNGSLYHLIRERAGSKMLREAEQMIAYNTARILFNEANEECVAEGFAYIQRFSESYPPLETEIPIDVILVDEIAQIDLIELKGLPWIYVEMLRSLTWNDEIAGSTLNEMLEDWHEPLSDVENGDAFDHAYAEWYNEGAFYDLDDIVSGLDSTYGVNAWDLPPLPPSPPPSLPPSPFMSSSPPQIVRLPLI